MPVIVRHMPISSGRDWAIVEKETGKVVGRSSSKIMAQRSANARNAAHFSDWKPTGKKARR